MSDSMGYYDRPSDPAPEPSVCAHAWKVAATHADAVLGTRRLMVILYCTRCGATRKSEYWL